MTAHRHVVASLLASLAVIGLSGLPVQASAAEQQRDKPALAPEARLFLELVVNALPTGRVVIVTRRDAHYYTRASELTAVGVRIDADPDAIVAIDQIPGVDVAYDGLGQRLEITVPVQWLPVQSFGRTSMDERVPALTSLGMLFNYDVFATSSPHGGSVSAWTEQRVFDRWGAVSNTGVVRRATGGDSAPRASYLRYDSRWSYSDEERLLTYTAGDLVTGALPWSTAVRLGGVSFERNFTVRPDIVTYPLPTFAGQAAVPTTVDLFINGSHVLDEAVPPGPFVVSGAPMINGSGSATVTTTDVLGRQTSTTTSFYVASSMLKPGLFDFSVSAGWTRRRFGVSSWGYGAPAASGVIRYGLTNFLTLAGHGEGGPRLAVGGLGADLRLGALGVLGVAVARGGAAMTAGTQYAASYHYTARRYSIMVRHLQRESGFTDLSSTDRSHGGSVTARARRTDQLTAAVSPAGIGGTVGIGYFSVIGADGERNRVVNASYSRGIVWGTSLHISANNVLSAPERSSVQVQLVVPMGRRGAATASVTRTGDSTATGRVQYSRHVPPGGGFGWSAGLAPDTARYRQVDLTWRTRAAQVQAGLYGQGNAVTRWGNLSGSLVAMGGEFLPANRVDDAFVLIDTDGQPGVPVLFENQPVGRTNRRGRLLVPWVSSYYPSKVAIDPLELPAGVRTPVVEQRRAVRRQSGGVIRFPIVDTAAALVTLVDGAGASLPLGLRVIHLETGQISQVGWDGQVYFENLEKENRLQVSLPGGEHCSARFSMSVRRGQSARVGPLTCQ